MNVRNLHKVATTFTLLILASQIFIPMASGANPDDGYPQGQPAPGRTCPNSDEGAKNISEFNGKTFICTMINGTKKWWIEGEALPTPSAPSSGGQTSNTQGSGANLPTAPTIEFTHTYILPASSLAKMNVFVDVVYSKESASQRLDIYLPKGVKNPPLLIYIHGGGFVFGDENAMKFDDPAKLLEVLIKNGIAVASVNYRLATEALFPTGGRDVKTSIRFLRANASKYGFDSKKFATLGDSAGAYLALMAAITGNQKTVFDNPKDPNLKTSASVSAVFDLFGNVNFLTMRANNLKYPCQVAVDPNFAIDPNVNPWFGDITLPANRPAVDSANLYPYLKASKSLPVFYIFHGTADCSVSKYDSIELDKEVKALKGKSFLNLVPDEIHGGPKIWIEVAKFVPVLKKLFGTIK